MTAGLAASRWLAGPLDRFLDRLPLEFFLLSVFAFLVGTAAIADELGLSEAIGALMAGIVLSETSVREQIEERFFSFRDVFAALFFFSRAVHRPVRARRRRVDRRPRRPRDPRRQDRRRLLAGRIGGFTRRQSLNAGVALVAHGEFTVILAQLASDNPSVTSSQSADLVAFAGLYVLATATVGIVLMKESKRLGRIVFPIPRLTGET